MAGDGGKGGGTPASNDDLIARYGSADAALTRLRKDNAKLRAKNRELLARGEDPAGHHQQAVLEFQRQIDELELENAELRTKMPAAGATILTADQAKAWEAFGKLGQSAEDLTKQLEAGQTAAQERDQLRFAQSVRDAADLHGYRPTVLQDLLPAKGLHLELVEEADPKDSTKKMRVAKVRPAADAAAALVALPTYVEQQLAEYLPALQADPGDGRSAPPPFPGSRSTRRTAATPVSDDDRLRQKRATGTYRF